MDLVDFPKTGREYIIKINKNENLPVIWSHILANKNFGTVVTSNMGGFTWRKNSRLGRITAWANNPEYDIPSEIIYLKDMEYGKRWSLNFNPSADNEDYYIIYGFGYAKYYHASLGIIQELETFVPVNDGIKVNILRLKNTTSEKRTLKCVYYIKPVLGEDEIKSNGYIGLSLKNNTIIAKNIYGETISNFAYVMISNEISSYTGNKASFIGNKDLENPEGIDKVELDFENSLGNDGCIVVETKIELEPYEDKKIVLSLGEEDIEEKIFEITNKYKIVENAEEELKKTKEYWNTLLRNVQVKTPEDAINIMLNGWTMYQTIVCRLYARSGYYQSGGAFGFRDQLQDAISTKFIDIGILENQILKHASHQFEEGDVEHWWHDETKHGIRTRFSDDLLWLVYSVCEYIEFTGEYDILEKEVPYLVGNELKFNEDERYDLYEETDKAESVYKHCIKAIEKSMDFGENKLPKIGSGDWNDGFSSVGNKGIGESIWLGFFLYNILDKFNKICEKSGKIEYIQKYERIKENLRKALNTNGWDGRWYRRAYTDDGEILGTYLNKECQIDSIAQSWAVISDAGDNDKKYMAMENLEKHLVNRDIRNNKITRPSV